MYCCHIQFYLAGYLGGVSERIKGIPPLENFTHGFWESERPEGELAAGADVILAGLPGLDEEEALRLLVLNKSKEAELILLADKGQMGVLEDYREEITDIWVMPMMDGEVDFRFRRWQQTYKLGKDYWQSNQFLEAAINHVPNLIWYKNKQGIHEKVNDSFCQTVNKAKEQVEGQSHAYIWDVEQDDPACIESERVVMSERRTCISEESIQTGGGTRILTTYKSPLYDWDGSVMGTVGVAIDITQERVYEQEIMQKSRTLEMIFMAMDCGVMCHTVDGSRILSVNRAALKILGYESQEEMVAAGFSMIAASVVEEDRAALRERIAELKAEGDSVSTEYRVRHKDGKIVHIVGNVKLVEENGQLYYQRFLLDCTDQKRQEIEHERRQEELVHALSIDYSLVCYYDLKTGKGKRIRNTEGGNPMFGSVFDGELTLKESMELYIQTFVYEEDREMMRQASSREKLEEELAGKKLYYVNYRTFRNEEIQYFQMKVVRTGEWEENQGIVVGFRSVDEEIRDEMEKKRMLEDALSQANRASKAKSVFLSNMSHDIRTPMNAIVGFTALALTHINHTEQVEEYLKKIMTSGNHLLNLINDVLDMSRIESGKMHLEEKPCSLPEILHGLRNILQADVRAKQLELHIDTADVFDGEIYCDKLRLNQVLLNLLGNAVKYTEAGGIVSLRVTEKSGAPSGYANYEFLIKDTGMGMSEEFVAHIFEPFERERNTTISKIQGTGLGMAITKNIVDMMNGDIHVKSRQGVGTEISVSFTFRLNSDAAGPQDIPELKDTRALAVDEPLDFRAGRLLLAEDNELNQEIAVAILGEAGFTTEVAENGRIAVDMVKKSEPGYYQAVLMDIQMPVMNGYEAAKEIRKCKEKDLASMPIIAMTANAFEEDKKEALASGMNGHIAKPIDVAVLFETLRKILV